jgi:hypothetical protein
MDWDSMAPFAPQPCSGVKATAGGDTVRIAANIAVATAMAVAAMWAADVITRPPQMPTQSSLSQGASAEMNASSMPEQRTMAFRHAFGDNGLLLPG